MEELNPRRRAVCYLGHRLSTVRPSSFSSFSRRRPSLAEQLALRTSVMFEDRISTGVLVAVIFLLEFLPF